jgi:hypothetical protein
MNWPTVGCPARSATRPPAATRPRSRRLRAGPLSAPRPWFSPSPPSGCTTSSLRFSSRGRGRFGRWGPPEQIETNGDMTLLTYVFIRNLDAQFGIV